MDLVVGWCWIHLESVDCPSESSLAFRILCFRHGHMKHVALCLNWPDSQATEHRRISGSVYASGKHIFYSTNQMQA
ncbi:hypothetical protein BX661DRAFT_186747 [Kickxella alabastrina]|uniref:uncharacterized protein n=1 Tax=Kickxella alabastrina TaxID=61397 RepID=UPI002220E0DB|nr:uncharacterized protein BX661DRAFT_186747 [Kickxella alabastrina]KAI7823071.1 hypothetical protein BX661DRAFT_186747 [Kickxella alabastrina]